MINIKQLNYGNSNEFDQMVEIPKINWEFNLNNYKTHPKTMMLANVLAMGGVIKLAGEFHYLDDWDLIEHYRLAQLEWAIGQRYKNSNFTLMDQELDTAALNWFNTLGEARKYFTTTEWETTREQHKWKANLLDIMKPQLMEAQEKYLLEKQEQEDRKHRAVLINEMYEMGLKSEDYKKDLPNQEVTPLALPSIEVQERYMEGEAPYISYTGEDEVRYYNEVEAKLVNAWYYNNGFRVPTLDDQIEELAKLREWFETYKYNIKRTGPTKPQAKTLEKFEQLEFLEIEVGPYTDGQPSVEHMGNQPRISDHDSRGFKLNRLAQLLRMEKNDPRLVEEQQELIEELNQ